MSAFLEAALRCTLPVFPCRPGTKGTFKGSHGFEDATRDPDVIRRWWSICPNANVAIPTGEASDLVVLDIDRDGWEWSLVRDLPGTVSVKTPRGGQHFYFRHPGFKVPNSVKTIAPGIDIRGDGGYVLIPPSVVGGRRYELDEQWPPAPMPDWLIELAVSQPDAPGESTDPDEWVAMVVGGIPDGRRNVDLTRFAGYLLRRYVAVDVVVELVHLVNQHRCRPPKPKAEVDRILDSIALRELRRREATP